MTKLEQFISIGGEFLKRISKIKEMLKEAEEVERKRLNGKYVRGFDMWELGAGILDYSNGIGVNAFYDAFYGEMVYDLFEVETDEVSSVDTITPTARWIFEDDWYEVAKLKISNIPEVVRKRDEEHLIKNKKKQIEALVETMNYFGLNNLDECKEELNKL